ncbi:DNA polymerase III subunit delta [Butyrivibrio proteoclasticus]|uniref:DNA polymerase III subunit delta n=1 Tax=Butyrivibrio proteoclasticus TaxID=43305 RepID=UPI00047B7AC4|nr:hypothetical protein [Butyrivibrio proteoclasticus]
MIQIVYGTEPYGIDLKRRKLIDSISTPAVNLSSFVGVFNVDILNVCNTYPFLAEKRGVILEIDGLKDLDTAEFKRYMKNPPATTDLIIIAKKVDQRTKLYKTFDEAGLMVPCNKLKTMPELQKVIFSELRRQGATIKEDAYGLFVKKMNYFDNDGVTLLDVVSCLNSCISISNELTVDIIEKCCPSYEEANIFALASLIKENKADALYEQISLISEKDAIGILSLLLKDFRVAYKLKYYSDSEVGTKRTAFSTYDKTALNKAMLVITSTIAGVKNGSYSSDNALRIACSQLLTINRECA